MRRTFFFATLLLVASAAPGADDETEVWQARIDAASAAGGGTVTVTPGGHVVGGLMLKSGVTLEIPEGAALLGATNAAAYARCPVTNLCEEAVVVAAFATNVAIVGKGRIDGRGSSQPKLRLRPLRWRNVCLFGCTGVRIEDVTMENPSRWTCFLRECEDVTVRRLVIRSHANFNNDGLDLTVRNAVIEDCDIDSDDDSIVLKNHNPAYTVENVKVRRCRVGGNTNGLKIGTETFGDFRNILFEDCIVSVRQNSAVWPLSDRVPGLDRSVASGKGGIVVATVDGGSIDGVTFRNIEISGTETPIYVRHGRRRNGDRPGVLRNVLIENVRARAVSRIASSVTGVPGEPRRRPEAITLRDIMLDVPGGATASEAWGTPVPECEKGYPSPRNFNFHALPACGVYVRHADGVKLENVKVVRRASDVREDFVFEDVR